MFVVTSCCLVFFASTCTNRIYGAATEVTSNAMLDHVSPLQTKGGIFELATICWQFQEMPPFRGKLSEVLLFSCFQRCRNQLQYHDDDLMFSGMRWIGFPPRCLTTITICDGHHADECCFTAMSYDSLCSSHCFFWMNSAGATSISFKLRSGSVWIYIQLSDASHIMNGRAAQNTDVTNNIYFERSSGTAIMI